MKSHLVFKVITITLLSLFIFSSCSQDNSTPINNQEGSSSLDDLYYFEIGSDQILYKYNLNTNTTTTACIDPLCSHGDNCIFSGVNYVITVGNTVYFSRMNMNSLKFDGDVPYINEEICVYEYDTGSTRKLCEIECGRNSSLQGFIEYCDGYIYFYRQTPDANVTEYSLYRVSVDNGRVDGLGLSVPMWHGARYDNYLIFSDGIGSIYQTDIFGKQKKTFVITDGIINILRNTSDGYLYYIVNGSDNVSELYKYNLQTGENNFLYRTNSIVSLFRIDKQLYFLSDSEKSTDKINYNGIIYTVSTDGDKIEHYFNDPSVDIRYLRVCGTHLLLYKNVYDSDGNKIIEKVILT